MIAGSAFSALAVALSVSQTGDYSARNPVAGDNAAPALNALIHGQLRAFVSHQPLMGLTSLLVRAPFLWVASLLGTGGVSSYQLGSFACLLGVAMLAAWLMMRARGRSQLIAAVIGALVILAGPATRNALAVGHPEEVLCSALATAAVLLAIGDRALPAGVLLGLAIGTKQWALLAAAPVLLTLRQRRGEAAGVAALVGVAVVALLPLADPSAFSRAGAGVGGGLHSDPFSLWWPFGTPLPGLSARRLPLGLSRNDAALVALAPAALAVLVWCRHARPRDGLAVLAALCLLRCALDPTPLEYNFVAVVVPLVAWEALRRDRLPLASLAVSTALAVVYGSALHFSAAQCNGLSVLFVVALLGYLLLAVRPLKRAPRAPITVRCTGSSLSAPR